MATGAYVRAERDGKWTNIEVEYLTDKELDELFKRRSNTELLNWMKMLCKTIRELEIFAKDTTLPKAFKDLLGEFFDSRK